MNKKLQPTYELIPQEETTSFAVREFRLPRFTSSWHLHPEIELTLILSGTGTRFVGDSAAAFRPGDLVLIGANLPHYWRCANPPTTRAHSVVIQFREDCLGADFFHRPEMSDVLLLLKRARRGLTFPVDTRNETADRMKSLLKLRGAEQVAAFVSILAQLARAKRSRPLSGESFLTSADFSGHDHIHRACRYVFEHLTGKVRLADAAKAAALSPEALCRLFKRSTGSTFFDFVNDARIGHACVQLIETDTSIGEIAFTSGFNTLANFNRRFRERKHKTPREFRTLFQNLKSPVYGSYASSGSLSDAKRVRCFLETSNSIRVPWRVTSALALPSSSMTDASVMDL